MNESNVSTSNISLVNTYCKYWEPDTDFEKIAKRTVYVLLIVLGISLNIFVIVLAAKFTVRKNLHHLIINMAISDALFLFMRFWDYLPWNLDYKWRIYSRGISGVIFCKASKVLYDTSYMVSLITLLIISIERFKVTRQRLQRSRQYTLKQRLLVIGFTWLISSPFAVYYATRAVVYYDGRMCAVAGDDRLIRIIIFISNWSVIAILCCVIFLLCILTIRRLTKPQAIRNHLSQDQQQHRARRTQAAVRMVLASVLLYVCCWLSYSVYYVLFLVNVVIPSAHLFPKCFDRRSLIFIVYHLLPVINSCFSPSIYIVFLSDFRKAAKNVFCRSNTVNEAANRRNSFELQPIPRRQHEQDQDVDI